MLSERLDSLPYLVHTNRELGLMLRGIKPLAYFMEVAGTEPDACIRYWRMFDRHVAVGRLIKREAFEAIPNSPLLKHRSLFYALPEHEWRVDAMLALLRETGPWNDDRERRFGELLGYEDWQMEHWLAHRFRMRADSRMSADPADQWRIDNASHLKGVRFQFRRYTRWSENWDHDHCAACRAKFAEGEGPDIQHEGYATCDDYRHGACYEWVCKDCFHDLQGEMQWQTSSSRP